MRHAHTSNAFNIYRSVDQVSHNEKDLDDIKSEEDREQEITGPESDSPVS